MSVPGTSIGVLTLLSKAGKVPILQPYSVKSDTVTPSFYFFNVLGLSNNCAKFQQILITNCFSMESP